MPAIHDLATRSTPFLTYLEQWYNTLPEVDLATIIGDAPERVALCSIDMINGFCKEGPLAGPRRSARWSNRSSGSSTVPTS